MFIPPFFWLIFTLYTILPLTQPEGCGNVYNKQCSV
jgi:hypothetical protein